jgi:TetR/AcrR family transcriptional regulator, transcriptional repressor for nem operon
MPKPNVREKIVTAGFERLHRHGFNGSGVQDITDAAEVPKGSFYNHFESKEALGLAALDRYWELTERGLQILSDERIPPLERLRSYFQSLADLMKSWRYAKGCMVGNFSTELADQSRSIRDRLSMILAAWTRAIENCIREAQTAKAIDSKLDPAILAAFLLNSWEGAVMRSRVDKDGKAQQQFLATVFANLFEQKQTTSSRRKK